MDFGSATLILFVIAAVFAVVGLLFFIRPRWFLAWLKGTFAFALIFAGGVLFLLAWDLRAYQSLTELETVASITVREAGPQRWEVSLVSEGLENGRQVFLLQGDQWQLDARIMRFSGPLRWLGLQPAYRLERISGRYITLRQAREAPHTVHGIGDTGWIDFWALDQRIGLPLLESQFGSATFMPLEDNAIYDIQLGYSGLAAVPVNDVAKAAVNGWGS